MQLFSRDLDVFWLKKKNPLLKLIEKPSNQNHRAASRSSARPSTLGVAFRLLMKCICHRRAWSGVAMTHLGPLQMLGIFRLMTSFFFFILFLKCIYFFIKSCPRRTFWSRKNKSDDDGGDDNRLSRGSARRPPTRGDIKRAEPRAEPPGEVKN